MADPFKNVTPGEPVGFNSIAWNAMLEAGKAFKGAGLNTTSSPLASFRQSVIVKVKNETEVDMPRASILGLDGPLFTPTDSEDAFMREVVFRGGIPDTNAHRRRFAVLLDPAKAGSFARAYVAGVCQVGVDVLDPSHEYANITDGEHTTLISSRYGFAQILWREGDEGYGYETGQQWAIVRLAAHCAGFAIGRAKGDIGARSGTTYGTGEVDLYRSVDGAEDGPIDTIPVLNASTAMMTSAGIDDGIYVAVAWDADGVAWVSPLECASESYYY